MTAKRTRSAWSSIFEFLQKPLKKAMRSSKNAVVCVGFVQEVRDSWKGCSAWRLWTSRLGDGWLRRLDDERGGGPGDCKSVPLLLANKPPTLVYESGQLHGLGLRDPPLHVGSLLTAGGILWCDSWKETEHLRGFKRAFLCCACRMMVGLATVWLSPAKVP